MDNKDFALNYYLSFENLSAWLTPTFVSTHAATLSDSVQEEEVAWRKSTNKILTESFLKLIEKTSCDAFIELGAFDGSMSLKVENLGIHNIVAFEANPYTYDKFKNNFVDSSVKYINLGISGKEDTLDLKIPKHQDSLELPNSSMLRRSENSDFTKVQVECIGLDQITAHTKNPFKKGALWVDLEGLAYEVLSGSNSFLSNIELIFIEVEDFQYWKDQKLVVHVIELLLSKGFIPLIRDFEGRGQYNIIFATKNNTEIFNSFVSEYFLKIISLDSNDRKQSIFKKFLKALVGGTRNLK